MALRPDSLPMPHLIVFGGSFDPPHSGHVGCTRKILDRFPQSRVLVTPTPSPPPVAKSAKTPVAPYQARLRMCQEAFRASGTRIEVSNIEATLSAPHYTIATLRALRQTTAEPLGLMIGQDQLEQFLAWREPREILRLASLIVLARPPDHGGRDRHAAMPPRGQLRTIAETLTAQLGFETLWLPEAEALRLRDPAAGWQQGIFILPGTVGSMASSLMRERLATHPAAALAELPPSVSLYIQEQGLYGLAGTLPIINIHHES